MSSSAFLYIALDMDTKLCKAEEYSSGWNAIQMHNNSTLSGKLGK